MFVNVTEKCRAKSTLLKSDLLNLKKISWWYRKGKRIICQ
jgi:hypothetical protein